MRLIMLLFYCFVILTLIWLFDFSTKCIPSPNIENADVVDNKNNFKLREQPGGDRYDLSFGSTAHWDIRVEERLRKFNSLCSPHRLSGSFLVPMTVRLAILADQNTKTKTKYMKYYAPGGRKLSRSACRFCFGSDKGDECVEGQAFTRFGAEEVIFRDLGQLTALKEQFVAYGDMGSETMMRAINTKAGHTYASLHFRCDLSATPKRLHGRVEFILPKDGTYGEEVRLSQTLLAARMSGPFAKLEVKTVSFPVQAVPCADFNVSGGGGDIPITAQSLKTSSLSITGKPVVCSRQIFGTLDGRYLSMIAQHNIAQGIATTIVYELGNSRVVHREVLRPHLESGALLIIDLRDLFQDLFGISGRSITIDVKAASQWLTRWDCVDRLRPLNPSWILFLDMDEFVIPGVSISETTTLAQYLNNVSKPKHGVVFLPTKDGPMSFCNNLENVTTEPWDEVKYIAEQRAFWLLAEDGRVPQSSHISNDKYAVRPNMDLGAMRVHHFYKPSSGWRKLTIKPTEFFLRHHRCMNKILSDDTQTQTQTSTKSRAE